MGSCDPMHNISPSVSAKFMSPHFCLLVVSLLVVVMNEVISTMGKASSKPKAPLDLVLSQFQDIKDTAAVPATHVKSEQLKTCFSLECPAFGLTGLLQAPLIFFFF